MKKLLSIAMFLVLASATVVLAINTDDSKVYFSKPICSLRVHGGVRQISRIVVEDIKYDFGSVSIFNSDGSFKGGFNFEKGSPDAYFVADGGTYRYDVELLKYARNKAGEIINETVSSTTGTIVFPLVNCE